MKAFWLTWNPKRWPWDELATKPAYPHQAGWFGARWSVGNRTPGHDQADSCGWPLP